LQEKQSRAAGWSLSVEVVVNVGDFTTAAKIAECACPSLFVARATWKNPFGFSRVPLVKIQSEKRYIGVLALLIVTRRSRIARAKTSEEIGICSISLSLPSL